ncbi:Phage tail protein [Nitrosococcus oceani ATCC 19707]|uniref:Phage tail protein n=2 Tax=Nitrosococcus oceani TaxID=1229 RepID=Q3JA19_NITOC|nr:Phage tail protein [Nitrosococcus oceani ATCC 19707]KFI19257.1 tail protein [Nitrosococcus oceani C-27]
MFGWALRVSYESRSQCSFSVLNRDNEWPDFQWEGLELLQDGTLRLYSIPLLKEKLPEEIEAIAPSRAPAGITVDLDGTVYFSDPAAHRLLKIDGCNSELKTVPCIGSKNGKPTQLNGPRGLLIPPHRRSLLVVDSGNHRIQIFDIASLQLVAIWGQQDPFSLPQPSDAPGYFNTPWTLAADTKGNVYVVDYGNQRVQKFNFLGEVIPDFWETLQAANLQQPSDIAAGAIGEELYFYIVAQDAKGAWKIFVVDNNGHPVLDTSGQSIAFGEEYLEQPMGIAVDKDTIYVGDNNRRRVLTFKKKSDTFEFAGEALGYEGPVAALALDGKEGLLIHSGIALAPLRLTLDSGYRNKGMLWSRVIKSAESKVQWHRLHTIVDSLESGAHIQFFVHTSDQEDDPPLVDPSSPNPFSDAKWRALPLNVSDFFIGDTPACCLWIGAVFSGDGSASPIISQMRVEFDQETYLKHLPAIYINSVHSREFLVRFLPLFESFFNEVEGTIAHLPALFDPNAIPKEMLSWLAGWLAMELDEDWDGAMQRQVIVEAFENYAWQGTAEGLRRSLRLFAGVHAIIEEPNLNSAWWVLPIREEMEDKISDPSYLSWGNEENSILGFTTRLASAEPQGAVVGTTTILDQSHLITSKEFGAPLFEDVAYQFSVLLYRGELRCADTLLRVRAVIEREKPAHTSYQVCIIEPRMRVGYQARVGVDTVIAGPPSVSRLGENSAGGVTLGGEPAGRIGERNQVGLATRVG